MKERNVKLSYLAGIIDGEGTIGIFKSRQTYRITLKVGNTSESLINYLRENFGGNKMGPYKGRKKNHKDIFEWDCNSKEAIKLIKEIRPYLIIKQEQAVLAINAWNVTFKKSYTHSGSEKTPKYESDKRKEYYKQMKRLNVRGKQDNDGNNHDTVKERCSNTLTKEIATSYLAGIVDGEGTIGIYKTRQSYRILLQIINTSEELMAWLKWNFYGNLNGPYEEKKPNWKERFEWRCYSSDAIRIVKEIEQYLVIKNKQAELAINAWNDTFKINYHNKKIPKFATSKREQYREQMNQLNMKGTHAEKMMIPVPFEVERNTLKEWYVGCDVKK